MERLARSHGGLLALPQELLQVSCGGGDSAGGCSCTLGAGLRRAKSLCLCGICGCLGSSDLTAANSDRCYWRSREGPPHAHAGDCDRPAARGQVHPALHLQVYIQIACSELLYRHCASLCACAPVWRRTVSREVSPAVALFPAAGHPARPERMILIDTSTPGL
jgi:hypothetical protein